MKKYEYILFDLDGTLIDSGPGIMKSIAYALDNMEVQNYDADLLRKCVGPPLKDSFSKLFNIEEERISQAIDYYRECYKAGAIFDATLYDGILEVLGEIQKSGRKIAMATSKPEHFAKMIAEKMGFEQYFDYIAGATIQETRTTKSEVIEYAFELMGNPPRESCLMIGDRMYDIIGAKECGIDSLGVLYGGYGTREEFVDSNADFIADTALDILKYI